MLSRRAFLWSAAASSVLHPWAAPAQASDTGTGPFRHGVASGDPLEDRVVLWTRVTPADPARLARPAGIRWRVATDTRLTRTVRSGTVTTTADRDFTVKVDARGLEPGRTYYYAFEMDGHRSPVGRTKTLPAATDRVRLGVVSCANFPAGYFNVYRLLANREDLDAIVHVGDYIYEFANGVYGDGAALQRLPQPLREAYSLQDYRMRYATYRTDEDLQQAHQQHPFIAVWDDHELANNAWSGGAENHHPEQGQGDWLVRRAAAYRAYMEWMPIREPAPAGIRLYRAFRYGTLADLVMLDTRGLRDRQVAGDDLAGLADANRRVLGAPQETWLYDTLRASQRAGVTWRTVGQQVMFARVTPPAKPVLLPDSWDGYQAERDRLLDFFHRERVGNVAILSGDMHSSWAFDVPRNPWAGYQSRTGEGSLAVEMVVPAISSPSFFDPAKVENMTAALRIGLPHLKFLDGLDRGYVLLDLTRARLTADWYLVDTVTRRATQERLAASFVCEAGSSHLAPA